MRRLLFVVLVALSASSCSSADGGKDIVEAGGEGDANTNGGSSNGGGANTGQAGGGNSGNGGSDGNPDAGDPVSPPGCGDGERVDPERCEDGNTASGDGCDLACQPEQGWNCPAGGGACAPVCGDRALLGREACDDGNAEINDGCDRSCNVEQGWVCPDTGDTCEAADCGDGILAGAETCDDGATRAGDSGDGCGAVVCLLEPGWVCPVEGEACVAAECGDGIVAGDERCDDGKTAGVGGAPQGGDGCSAGCNLVEPNFVCPVMGGSCTRTTECGNGVRTSDEDCDDKNKQSADGCSDKCELEDGYLCPSVGKSCQAAECGDGVIAGNEECEDGNADPADGCLNCLIEGGYACETATASPPSTCFETDCGDGKTEGDEQCDDGDAVGGADNQLGDGCTPACTKEPNCTDGECVATCGDGILDGTQEEGVSGCDDGNNKGSDGCSATCVKETGFACSAVNNDPPTCVDLPIVYRDFRNGGVDDHPDFQESSSNDLQIVRARLGVDVDDDGIADASPPSGAARSVVYDVDTNGIDGATSKNTNGPVSFNQWYRDSALGRTVASTMQLCDDDANGTYVFDSKKFFPLDGKGFQDPSIPVADREASQEDCPASCSTGDTSAKTFHNFHFTSELRFWFTYKGSEVLTFRGDDDVWVFINGFRVINLGGIHCALDGTVTLTDVAGAAQANLSVGSVYEVVVFQAERRTCQSSYRLELGNFLSKRSFCESSCGDGIIASDEFCDDGKQCVGGSKAGQACANGGDCPLGSCDSRNDGTYGRCKADCTGFGDFCGDGATQASGGEVCDNGAANNLGQYDITPNDANLTCTPTCKRGPFCGDTTVDGFFGEQCDLGVLANNGDYGKCRPDCKFAPRCGDGTIQPAQGEQCDDKINRSAYGGCAPGCKLAPSCGDGEMQSARGEECDKGTAENDGGYNGCTATCKQTERCGDGVKQAAQGEACDDGNLNAFDGCSPSCQTEFILL